MCTLCVQVHLDVATTRVWLGTTSLALVCLGSPVSV